MTRPISEIPDFPATEDPLVLPEEEPTMPVSEPVKAALKAADERLARARACADHPNASQAGLAGAVTHLLVGLAEVSLAAAREFILDGEEG